MQRGVFHVDALGPNYGKGYPKSRFGPKVWECCSKIEVSVPKYGRVVKNRGFTPNVRKGYKKEGKKFGKYEKTGKK